MSPKLFIYNGIELLFFSNDHLPVHVHAIYDRIYGMKVEFVKKNNLGIVHALGIIIYIIRIFVAI